MTVLILIISAHYELLGHSNLQRTVFTQGPILVSCCQI